MRDLTIFELACIERVRIVAGKDPNSTEFRFAAFDALDALAREIDAGKKDKQEGGDQ